MERNLVSIILPVYNAEKQLERCVESILNQTYRNFELILVNDGSVDRSEELCGRFADADDRVILVNQQNAGPSEARNTGLRYAKGDYLQFVDADDFVEVNMTELLAEQMDAGSDLAICGFITESDNRAPRIHKPDQRLGMKKEEFLKDFGKMFQGFYINYLWNKMFRMTRIKENHILFDKSMRWGEDLFFNLEFLETCKGISVIGQPLYHYVDNDGSITTSFNPELFSHQQKMYEKVQAFLQKQGVFTGKNKEIFVDKYTNAIDMCVANLFRKDAGLTGSALKVRLQEIVTHPYVRSHKEFFFTGSSQKKVIGRMIKWQAPNGLVLYFRSKYAIKKSLGRLKNR